MRRNSRLAILIVFVVIAVFVWRPRHRTAGDASATVLSAASGHGRSAAGPVLRKRTECAEWGRNPFVLSQRKESMDDVSHMRLRAIIYSNEEARAAINESIVGIGDRMMDKTVERIEHNRVILTDGTQDYILELPK